MIPKKLFYPFRENKDLVYLDNAGTTFVPDLVAESLLKSTIEHSYPIGRSRYKKAEETTALYEFYTEKIESILCVEKNTLAFVSSATVASNMLALSVHTNLSVCLCADAHFSFICPWMNKKHTLSWLFPTNTGSFNYDLLEKTLIKDQPNILCLPLVSHNFGYTINAKQVKLVVEKNSPHTLIIFDACQAAGWTLLSEIITYCDGLFFSGHKSYAGHGLAVMYLSKQLQKILSPVLMGGGNIKKISYFHCEANDIIESFHAGSKNVGFLSAYVSAHNMLQTYGVFQKSHNYFSQLTKKLYTFLKNHDYHVWSSEESSTILSFSHKTIHANDIADSLSENNICVRSGFLCSDMIHIEKKYPALIRVSLGAYSETSDIDALCLALDAIHLSNK